MGLQFNNVTEMALGGQALLDAWTSAGIVMSTVEIVSIIYAWGRTSMVKTVGQECVCKE